MSRVPSAVTASEPAQPRRLEKKKNNAILRQARLHKRGSGRGVARHPFRRAARSSRKMLKINHFVPVTFACALGACSVGETTEAEPDPAAVEQLVMSFEAAEESPPAKVEEKLAKAERVVAAVDRAEPDRLAGAAEQLLAK
jgi:hypothetical protein